MITSINKSLKGVDIQCIQVHSSTDSGAIPDEEEFDILLGDINLDGIANELIDYNLLKGYLVGGVELNDLQLLNADLNGDMIVNTDDLSLMLPSPTVVGDVTGDATGQNYLDINQEDVDLAQDYIDGNVELSLQQISNGDLDGDGMITQADITLLEELIESLQPPEVDPVGDLIIDTNVFGIDHDNGATAYGVRRIAHSTTDDEISIHIVRDTPINESGDTIEELYNSWVENGINIQDSIATFVPLLLKEPWLTTHQAWYNAAGDYLVKSIEKIENFPGVMDHLNYYELILDAGGNIDAGWNLDALTLQDDDGAYDNSTNSGFGVEIYGEEVSPPSTFEPFEMMSTSNDPTDPNGGVYSFTATSQGTLKVFMYNGTQVTWNDHALGWTFYSKTWLDFKGLTNDSQDEYHLAGVRIRTHCTIRDQNNYNNLGTSNTLYHNSFLAVFDGTSWELNTSGLYLSGSGNKTAIAINGDTGIDANGDAILRTGNTYEIEGESISLVSAIQPDILDFGFSIEYAFWEED